MSFSKKRKNRMNKRIAAIMFLCIVIMYTSQTIEAKTPSNFYLNFCNDKISTEYDYSSKITFRGNKVIIKGYLTLKDDKDKVLGIKKKCILKISSNCSFSVSDSTTMNMTKKEFKKEVRLNDNNCYVGMTIRVRKGKVVMMDMHP